MAKQSAAPKKPRDTIASLRKQVETLTAENATLKGNPAGVPPPRNPGDPAVGEPNGDPANPQFVHKPPLGSV